MPTPLRVSVLACVASLTGLAVAAYGLTRPDDMIARSYTDAFGGTEPAGWPTAAVAGAGSASFDPAQVLLSSLPAVRPAGPVLGIGDRVTLAQRDGGAADYEVTDVRPLPAADLGAPGAKLPRLTMVTAVSIGGRLPVQTIRFLIDADAPTAPPVPAKQHAL